MAAKAKTIISRVEVSVDFKMKIPCTEGTAGEDDGCGVGLWYRRLGNNENGENGEDGENDTLLATQV